MIKKFAMQIDTDYGILFLSDAGPVSIPDEAGTVFAASTVNCVAFLVLHYVDGSSLVTIADAPSEIAGLKLFQGVIEAPSGIVTLSDSNSFHYLNIPVTSGPVSITICADHDRHPEWVWIQLGEIRSI